MNINDRGIRVAKAPSEVLKNSQGPFAPVNLDLVEDRLIKASSPRASKSDLIDCVADVTDLVAELRYLRIKARQFDRMMESHTLVQAAGTRGAERG